ncbi:MAG TPA: outer membrane protein assembly factor BamD [Candidatus Dependentiae bacterium]|jgi:outer membrane protein assembly factor BamD|nr:outer membrane protein assembly factor BamD [Candidatus Dependentiae bacterium]
MVHIALVILLLACGQIQCASERVVQPVTKTEGSEARMVPAGQPHTEQAKKPEEKKESSFWSFFTKRTMSDMSYEELKARKDELLKTDKKTAIKYLERMSHMHTDYNELKNITLELAQLLFETEDYAKASKMYHDFTLLFPGSDEAEFALYQAILASFNMILDPEHDQSKTIETQELAQTFLERSSFTAYKKEVEEIILKCQKRLLESEINIFNFYIKRGNFVAAKSRLSAIKLAYGDSKIPDLTACFEGLDATYAVAAADFETAQKTVVAVQTKNEAADEKETSFVDRF